MIAIVATDLVEIAHTDSCVRTAQLPKGKDVMRRWGSGRPVGAGFLLTQSVPGASSIGWAAEQTGIPHPGALKSGSGPGSFPRADEHESET